MLQGRKMHRVLMVLPILVSTVSKNSATLICIGSYRHFYYVRQESFPEKPVVTQLVNKLPACEGT
jgi:hypothetical protein